MQGDIHTETTYAVILNEDEAKALAVLADSIQERDLDAAIERAGKLSTDEGMLMRLTVVGMVKMAKELITKWPPSGPERISG